MKGAYLVPDNSHADMKPGQTGVNLVPISRMLPRSFITNLQAGAQLKAGARASLRGLAMGGDCGVAKVEISTDGGQSWQAAKLGHDEGSYSFRRWSAGATLGAAGNAVLAVRCTNTRGEMQPDESNWNGSGYMRNVIERMPVTLT
jgi:hypothetical protein